MVDIHSHVLPGLDDGARSHDESVEMLRLAAASGTTDIVATPHASSRFPFDAAHVSQLIAELRLEAIVNIHFGCDFHLNLQNLEDALAYPTKYTINHGRYLLVELPNVLGLSSVPHQLAALRRARIIPVITHPERNLLLQAEMTHLETWVKEGCLVQITAQSLLGRFGPDARLSAESLMNKRLAHFIASDAHDCVDRPPDLSEAQHYVASRWGRERSQRLFVDNPAAVLVDAPVDPKPPRTRRFSLFALGAK